jgi:hypothetical protein
MRFTKQSLYNLIDGLGIAGFLILAQIAANYYG